MPVPLVLACKTKFQIKRTEHEPGFAVTAGMKKNPKILLKKLDEESVSAAELIAEKKRMLKRATNNLEKENAKLVLKTAQTAAKAIQEHRALLQSQLVEKRPTGSVG